MHTIYLCISNGMFCSIYMTLYCLQTRDKKQQQQPLSLTALTTFLAWLHVNMALKIKSIYAT